MDATSEIVFPLEVNDQSITPSRDELTTEERINLVDQRVAQLLQENPIENSTVVNDNRSILSAQYSTNYIWGTLVMTKDIIRSFSNFIKTFRCSPSLSPLYLTMIENRHQTEHYALDLDCAHLNEFDPMLLKRLISFPQEIIPIFDLVASHLCHAYCLLSPESPMPCLEVRPFHLPQEFIMRDLSPDQIDQLISIRGMVIRMSQIIPDIRQACFQCHECHRIKWRSLERGRIMEPTRCDTCTSRFNFALIHNRSSFADKQLLKLQESAESVPEGTTPQTIQLTTHDHLVDAVSPGDKVFITGIYRASAIRSSSSQRTIKQIYRTHIDVLHIAYIERGRVTSQSIEDNNGDGNDCGESGEARKDGEHRNGSPLPSLIPFDLLSKRPDLYDLLLRSLAPSIWAMDDVKRGILCQLFGGTMKRFGESITIQFRPDINILLCGDPGTSKSQLLQYINKLVARSVYTSGKGSSAVGLTAYITKDPDTGETILESGALTLSDGGICCIDEFDKMKDNTRSILHEAMEQQTVSVAKAGIVATLNARTAILASANPRESRYNQRLSVVENIKLQPTLLSRFDLIYLILDNPSREHDAKLAKHIISLYLDQQVGTGYSDGKMVGIRDGDGDLKSNDLDIANLSILPTSILRQYIEYAKVKSNPILSDEASERLIEGYVNMRREGSNQHQISATTRQLESLIRISEALARMRLDHQVLSSDVDEAIRLMRVATYKAAVDPVTGKLDMDLICTGHSAAHDEQIKQLSENIMELIRAYPTQTVQEDNLFATLVKLRGSEIIHQQDYVEALHMIEDSGIIVIIGSGKNKTIKRL